MDRQRKRGFESFVQPARGHLFQRQSQDTIWGIDPPVNLETYRSKLSRHPLSHMQATSAQMRN
jgi:hypothetical protein